MGLSWEAVGFFLDCAILIFFLYLQPDRGMPSSKPTDNWYGRNWGLGVWPLMLWEDHEFAQRFSGLGGTSNPRFTRVIYGSLRRKLKKQTEFMTLPKRGQLLSAGLWVGEWCKSLIRCIFRGYDWGRGVLAIKKKKCINYTSTNLRLVCFLPYAYYNCN